MATILLSPAAPAIASASPALAAWWRRGHSYCLAAVVVGEIAATWFVVKLTGLSGLSPPLYELMMAGMIGYIFAKCFLLGLWAALGGLTTVPRWLVIGGVYVTGAMIVATRVFGSGWENFINNAPEIVLLGGALTAGFAALVLPLRRLVAWRIDFDAAYHPRPTRRRGQLALMDFAAMFCAVALPLTLCRVLMDSEQDMGADMLLFLSLFGLLVLVNAAPVARAVLVTRRLPFWLGGAAIWVVAMAWGQSLLAALVPDLGLFSTAPEFYGLSLQLLAFHVGIAAAVAAPLLVLRCCGLKLLVLDAA